MSIAIRFSHRSVAAWAARVAAPLALLVSAAALVPTEAAAQITTTIRPLQALNQGMDRVSYSESFLPAYVGYRVTFSGGTSRATLNSFIGTLSVSAGTSAAQFVRAEALYKADAVTNWVPYYAANCVPSTTTKVGCTPSSLTLGTGQSLIIDLYYTSPARVAGSTRGDCKSNINCLTQGGATKYTIGQTSTTKAATPAKVALGVYSLLGRTLDETGAIVSASPKDRTRTFYTGRSNDKSASPTDLFTTTVDVPVEAGSTTVSIVESLISKSTPTCLRFVSYCYQAEVTVPPPLGTTSFAPQYLTITMRADASNIAAGTTVNNVALDYRPDGSTTWYPIANCTNSTTPLPPVVTSTGALLYLPCVSGRQVDSSGDYVWQFISFKNGGFRML